MCGVVGIFSTVDGDKWWDAGTDTKHRTLPSFPTAWKQQGSGASLISALYLLRLSAGLDKCVSRCGKPPSPLTPTAAAASTAHAVVSPSSKLPAHVVMTRSNFGDIARVRHGDRFDVCLLFSVIWELVLDRSSKFVFPDILAEKKKKKKSVPELRKC